MHRIIAYLTGSLAMTIVAAATASAVTYAATHRTETLTNLGTSTLTGLGVAIGGCLGSALLLRFRSARRFVKTVLREINDKRTDK